MNRFGHCDDTCEDGTEPVSVIGDRSSVFQRARTEAGLRLTMSATAHNIELADEAVCAFIDGRQVDRFQVRLLVREALANAVRHGCGCDAALFVQLMAEFDDDGLRIEVSDPGPGFDWSRRVGKADALSPGGRGLTILDIYADEIEFNEAGNRVMLRKRYAPSASSCDARGTTGELG